MYAMFDGFIVPWNFRDRGAKNFERSYNYRTAPHELREVIDIFIQAAHIRACQERSTAVRELNRLIKNKAVNPPITHDLAVDENIRISRPVGCYKSGRYAFRVKFRRCLNGREYINTVKVSQNDLPI